MVLIYPQSINCSYLYREDYYDRETSGQLSIIEFLVYRGHVKSAAGYKGVQNKSTFKISNVGSFLKT